MGYEPVVNPFTKGKTASRTSNSVLTEVEVRKIRSLAASHSVKALAEAFGVGAETVRRILRRETWTWVGEKLELDAPIPALTQIDHEAAAASLKRVQELVVKPASTGLAKLNEIAGERVALQNEALAELAAGSPYDWIKTKNRLDE